MKHISSFFVKRIQKQKTEKSISFTTSIEPIDLKSTPRDKRSQLVLRGLTVTDGIKLGDENLGQGCD